MDNKNRPGQGKAKDSLNTQKQVAVYCGDKQYYDSYRIVHKKDSQELYFGKGVNITINKNQNTTQITYHAQGRTLQKLD